MSFAQTQYMGVNPGHNILVDFLFIEKERN